MKRFFYLKALSLCFTSPLWSQNILSGSVIDQADGQPLIGAFIQYEHTTHGTITNADGTFQLNKLDGHEDIVVKYLGYDTQIIKWNGDSSTNVRIELTKSNTTLNEIVISASPNNFIEDSKGSNYRITPTMLDNVQPMSSEEVLKTVPGVNVVGDMGLSNRPNISIRGSWGRRSEKIILLEDGSHFAPAPYIAPGAYYNAVSERIKSIEVYKGADLLKYGPNNMYGAINYITALPPQKPELKIKWAGGQRNYQAGLLSYGGTWNNLGALVEGVYKRFDGYIDNSSVEMLNLNAKIFAQLSENQSLYFKVSTQHEDNQASLAAQSPYTFEHDPTQNPFDADEFTMRRYGVDIIHKILPNTRSNFTTKLYASDFERDWWRQSTAKVLATDVKSYLGQEIFHDRYSYLEGQDFGPEDYVLVGKMVDGLESNTDSRWVYTVSGVKETYQTSWKGFGHTHQLEVSANLHRETFKDRNVASSGSRWSRSGTTTTDLWYRIWSINGYVRQQFQLNRWNITPILRYEHVDMYRQNLLQLSTDPGLPNRNYGRETNVYDQFMPGITIEYAVGAHQFYGSLFQGMTAPSKNFGFLVERDGVITNPLVNETINIKPELSWNREIGWRGELPNNRASAQIAYFNNTSRNFYLGGRNEVFETLGKINVQGIECAVETRIFKVKHHNLHAHVNINYMASHVIEGELTDNDLFSQIRHSQATKQEYIDRVNSHRQSFDIYTSDSEGALVPLPKQTLDLDDFDQIKKSVIKFGDDYIDDAEAPYTPHWQTNIGLTYRYTQLTAGVSAHYVGSQYTEFYNFIAESADGGIGKLPAYHTLDAFLNYDFHINGHIRAKAFINGKNITNDIYRASRLNRATSGLFGGGFRQIIFGVTVTI